jgi:hypothetical protein
MTRTIVSVVVAFACVAVLFSFWTVESPIGWYLVLVSGFVLGVICTGWYQSWIASKIATIKLSWWSNAIEVNLLGVNSIAALNRKLAKVCPNAHLPNSAECCSFTLILGDALLCHCGSLVSILNAACRFPSSPGLVEEILNALKCHPQRMKLVLESLSGHARKYCLILDKSLKQYAQRLPANVGGLTAKIAAMPHTRSPAAKATERTK